MGEPRGGPFVAQSEGNVVIFPWIRRREPTLNIFLQFVACETISVFPERDGNVKI